LPEQGASDLRLIAFEEFVVNERPPHRLFEDLHIGQQLEQRRLAFQVLAQSLDFLGQLRSVLRQFRAILTGNGQPRRRDRPNFVGKVVSGTVRPNRSADRNE
jgi:hypothetical protein